MNTQSNNLSFDIVKQLFKEAIDDASNSSELFEILNLHTDLITEFAQKVYQKGWTDGVKRGIKATYEYIDLYNKK